MKFKELTKRLCEREGKEHSLNIADMSEVLSCLGAEFATMGILETIETIDNLVAAHFERDIDRYGTEPLILEFKKDKPKKRKKK